MLRVLISMTAVLLLSVAANAVQLQITVKVTKLNDDGFIEFKAESDQKGEKTTRHLDADDLKRNPKKKFIFNWDMGDDADQNIWYWWDTLDGEADLRIIVTGKPGIPVTLFEAHCKNDGKGEKQVGKTIDGGIRKLIPGKNHYRRRPDFPPYISENEDGAITHIKECDHKNPVINPRDKAGEEWDLLEGKMIFEKYNDSYAFLSLETFKLQE